MEKSRIDILFHISPEESETQAEPGRQEPLSFAAFVPDKARRAVEEWLTVWESNQYYPSRLNEDPPPRVDFGSIYSHSQRLKDRSETTSPFYVNVVSFTKEIRRLLLPWEALQRTCQTTSPDITFNNICAAVFFGIRNHHYLIEQFPPEDAFGECYRIMGSFADPKKRAGHLGLALVERSNFSFEDPENIITLFKMIGPEDPAEKKGERMERTSWVEKKIQIGLARTLGIRQERRIEYPVKALNGAFAVEYFKAAKLLERLLEVVGLREIQDNMAQLLEHAQKENYPQIEARLRAIQTINLEPPPSLTRPKSRPCPRPPKRED
jgi:hypothetical protein